MARLQLKPCAVLSALATCGLAQPYNIWAESASGTASRVWFGDGQAYVGSTVPPSVKTAYTVTAPGVRNYILYVETDVANSAAGTPPLANPTFLVANAAPNESSSPSLFLSHSALGFTKSDVYLWISYDTVLLPFIRSDFATGEPYLVPTSTDGTYSVRYFADAGLASQAGGIQISLNGRT